MEMMSTIRNENSRFPFTSNQWQELEHQALVYKYMISGMPIPPDLLFSIKRSLDCSTKLFLHQHSPLQSIGWNCFQMGFGRKIDPDPGRCRRTDGKKWRCSKEAYSDSKYCERHLHRGRNRSRKPVEVVNKLSPNYPSPRKITTSSHFVYHPQLSSSSSSSSRRRSPGYVLSSQQDRFLLESSLYSHSEKDQSCEMKGDVDEHRFVSETCGSSNISASMADSWYLEPLAINNSSKQPSFFDYQNDYSYLQLQNTPTQQQQQQQQDQGRCYDQLLALKIERKNEPQKVMHHFFDESPLKDNDDRSKDKDSSTNQLSISISSHAHDFFLTHNDK